jgi:toxin FitB
VLPVIDSLLAATALHHRMVLVTRNERDSKQIPGLEIFNPWLD